jgi:hypothetical protein
MWHCESCGRNWIIERPKPGLYETPRCPNPDCNFRALNEGTADQSDATAKAILDFRAPGYTPQQVDPKLAVEVEPGVYVIEFLPKAGWVTDDVNGRWQQRDGKWFIERAQPFTYLTAWIKA